MDITVVEDNKLPMAREDALLAKVLESGNIEVLERFIALRAAEEERQAKMEFDRHFAEMRRELSPVIKSKKNAGTNSDYAPLEEYQATCDDTIFKHGFSYTWSEEALDQGRKRVILHISGWGYTQTNYWDAPAYEGNRATNSLQSAGVQTTYGKRYTFASGFGIVTKGEDTDGATFDIPPELSDALDKIRNADTLDKLMAAYQIAYERFKSDQNHLRLVVGEYTIAKKAMAGAK